MSQLKEQSARPAFFPHRKNLLEGGYNSICLGCFQTVATAKSEEELRAAEELHVCPTTSLSLLVARTRRDLQTQV